MYRPLLCVMGEFKIIYMYIDNIDNETLFLSIYVSDGGFPGTEEKFYLL